MKHIIQTIRHTARAATVLLLALLAAQTAWAKSPAIDPAHFSVNDAGTEYTIHTAEGWGYFCDLLANNDKGIFDGKTVKLGASITVTRMAGASNHDFTGTFDGNGKTLTLDYGSADSPINAQYVAPFLYTTDNNGSHPTFRNLTIDGHIYEAYTGTGEHHVGGLIAKLYGTVTIEHCTSNVSITTTGGAGGFVGNCENAVSFTDCVSHATIRSADGSNSGFVGWSRSSEYTISFEGCLFNGKLLKVDGNGASNGGFIGWKGDSKTVIITNSFCAPAALAGGETMADGNSATFSREHANHAATITNSFYTETFGTAQGKTRRTVTAAEGITISNIALTGSTTTYSTSGITAYANGGLSYGGDLYYGSGDQVSLTLSGRPSGTAPAGYQFASTGYTTNAGTLTGSSNPYTLTMADADATISALAPIDWATENTGDDWDNAYMIYNKDQLDLLAHRVNGGTDYSGKYFKQMADIELSGDWTPIGKDADHKFSGHYNGDGHTISGLQVTGSCEYAGLFGYIANGHTQTGSTITVNLTDIRIVDCNINVTGNNAGGIAGRANVVNISGCRVSGTITATSKACGLFGSLSGSGSSVTNCFVDVTVSATDKQSFNRYECLMANVSAGIPTVSGNYYHDNGGSVAVGITATPLYTVTAPSGLTAAGTNAMVTHNGTHYYAANATETLTVSDANKIITTFSVSGTTTYSLAADKKSATVTLASSDATVTATLAALTGTCGDGVTWAVTDTDNNGTYETLTLSGSGTVNASPWAADFAATIERVNIGSADITISGNPFGTLGNDAVIVAPTPAYAVGYSSAAFATKLRVALGSQLFTATTEGGTPAYQIATADDLRNLAAAVNATNGISTGKTFRQTADMDLASGGNFTPIGSRGGDYSFAGTYDGGGHTISGLTVSKDYGYIGLFGVVKSATVRNVILLSPNVNATTTSNYSVDLGALIGICGWGSSNLVENCHVVNPTVSSSSTSSKNYVGAIIGNIWDTNTTATNCYYYGGNATAACGFIEDGAPVTRVCAAHLVTLADGVTIQTPMAADLGFTCDADNNGTPENYWRTGAQLTLGYTGTVPDGYTIGYTATNGGTISGSTLTMPDADVTVTATVTVLPWSGDGSEGNPYIIYNKDQLDLLAHRVNGTHGETANNYKDTYFQLAKDISYTHKADGEDGAATESNYEAIGGFYNNNRSFRGHFDGNSKTISGIRIYKDGTGDAYRYQGIFGVTNGADIHDLTLADARITGYQFTGGIVGENIGGAVTRCHVAGDVAVCAVQPNAYFHGGIVGYNYSGGTIEQCTSAATLTTADATNSRYYGGIAGQNNGGTLRDNLAIGATVPAADYNTYGAITGENNGGTLQRNYYTACKVAGTPNATNVGCKNADVNNDNNPDGAVCINTLALAARKAPDGNYWTTYYNSALGFTIDADEHACAYTATYSTGQLTLHKLGKQIPKNTAVIIVADNGVVSMAAATDLDDFSGTNDLRGVDVDTPVANITSDLGEGTLYVLGQTTVDNQPHFGFHRYTGSEMAAHKAFVHVSGTAAARSLTMVFDDVTGIQGLTPAAAPQPPASDHWFTLDGRRLQAKPTAPGIYVNNGNKVVIK